MSFVGETPDFCIDEHKNKNPHFDVLLTFIFYHIFIICSSYVIHFHLLFFPRSLAISTAHQYLHQPRRCDPDLWEAQDLSVATWAPPEGG